MKLMDEIQIEMPDLGPKIKSVLDDTKDLVLIEAAPVCKTEQALLTWMLSRVFSNPGIHIWSSKNPRVYKQRMLHWLSTAVTKRFYKDTRGDITFPSLNARIIFCEHDDLMTQDVDRVGDVVITEAHDTTEDPQLWMVQNVAGKVRIAGQVGSPTHWFYRLCRKMTTNAKASELLRASYHKITLEDALKARLLTSEDVERVKSVIPDALFNQIYHCRAEAEIDLESARLSIRRFARHRLYIRDKAGKICPFEMNFMQQRYEAMKRLAVQQGKSKKYLLLKYRRGGFTTLEQANNYKQIVTQPNSQVVTLAHSADSTRRIFRIAHLYHEKDTRALSLKGTTSGSKLEIDALNSLFFIGTAGATGFGRGDTLQRVHGCLHPKTPIIGTNGQESTIAEIEIGSQVITHNGHQATVINKIRKDACDVPGRGQLVKVTPWSGRPISLTPDHKVWTQRGWIEACHLEEDDLLSMPIREITSSISEIEAAKVPHWKNLDHEFSKIALNREIGFAFGYYLAEGCVYPNHKTKFTYHEDEDYIFRVEKALEGLFTSVYHPEEVNESSQAAHSVFYGSQLANTIELHFGESENKRVPDWVFKAGKEFCFGLLEGWLSGDGDKVSNNPHGQISGRSICSSVIHQMRDIAASLGLGWGSVYVKDADSSRGQKKIWILNWTGSSARKIRSLILGVVDPEPAKTHRTRMLTSINNDKVWMRIRKISWDFSDYVYDIEVNHEDHSFRSSFTLSNSEVSKWCKGPRQIEQVNDLIAGLTEAASHGEVVLETTADGHEWFAMTYKEAKKGTNDWVPIFVPWFMDRSYKIPVADPREILDTLTEDEKMLIEMHHLSVEQIHWRRKKISGLQKLFKQEYPEDDETCFLTTGTSFFDSDLILDLVEKLPEPKRQHLAGGSRITWEEPIPGEKYVIGVDTSEGIAGCDPNGLGVLHKESGRQVASIHGLFRPDKLANHVCETSKKYNDALFGIERENHGHAVLQKVRELGLGKSHEFGGPCFHFAKERMGWTTNEQTRPIMLDNLAVAVHEGYMKCVDRDFLGECLTFKLQSNGNYSADPGCHDDSVMKYAIAWQMRNVRRIQPRITIMEQ